MQKGGHRFEPLVLFQSQQISRPTYSQLSATISNSVPKQQCFRTLVMSADVKACPTPAVRAPVAVTQIRQMSDNP